MADLGRSATAGLQKLLANPIKATCALAWATALVLAGGWAVRQVLLNPLLPSDATWEMLCVGKEITQRKCVIALGGSVRDGLYLIAAGGQVQGVVAVGQVAVGIIIAVGWVSLGALFSAGVTALCPLVVVGLVAFGGLAPSCVVGATLAKAPQSQGILNFAFLELTAHSAGRERKAKESPWPGYDDEGWGEEEEYCGGGSEGEGEGEGQLRRRGQAASEDWPYESSRGGYAQGA